MSELIYDKFLFAIDGYQVSFLELTGTLFGFISVWLLAKKSIIAWPTGIISLLCFSIIFYQVGLYPDMVLQIYMIGVSVYGWMYWKKSEGNLMAIKKFNSTTFIKLAFLAVVIGIFFGYLFSKFPVFFPVIFPKPTAFPYADSLVLSGSLIALHLQSKKYISNWIFWFVVDVISVVLYWKKGIKMIAIEYLFFCGMAAWGYWRWKKQLD